MNEDSSAMDGTGARHEQRADRARGPVAAFAVLAVLTGGVAGCVTGALDEEAAAAEAPAASTEAVLAATADPRDCSVYPERRVYLEVQSWWQEQGSAAPHHIHMGTCFPLMQEVRGVVPFNVRVITHNNPGTVRSLGVQIFDNGPSTVASVPLDLRCAEHLCTHDFRIAVDTTKVAYDGRWEWRFLTRIADTTDPGTDAEFTTTRWHAILRNGKTYRDTSASIDRTPGAAGWYEGMEYNNVFVRNAGAMRFLQQPQAGVVALDIKVDGSVVAPGRLFVAADPDFHQTIPSTGAVFYDGPPGTGYRTVSIDTRRLPNGPHRLHIRSEAAFSGANGAGTGSGVMVLPFTVQNP